MGISVPPTQAQPSTQSFAPRQFAGRRASGSPMSPQGDGSPAANGLSQPPRWQTSHPPAPQQNPATQGTPQTFAQMQQSGQARPNPPAANGMAGAPPGGGPQTPAYRDLSSTQYGGANAVQDYTPQELAALNAKYGLGEHMTNGTPDDPYYDAREQYARDNTPWGSPNGSDAWKLWGQGQDWSGSYDPQHAALSTEFSNGMHSAATGTGNATQSQLNYERDFFAKHPDLAPQGYSADSQSLDGTGYHFDPTRNEWISANDYNSLIDQGLPGYAGLTRDAAGGPAQTSQAAPQGSPSTGMPQGTGSASLSDAISKALAQPSRYDSSAYQQIQQALTGGLKQQFGSDQQALDEEMARRGLSSSSIGSQYQTNLKGQQDNALSSLNASLLQDAAGNEAADRSSALGAAQNFATMNQQGSQFTQSQQQNQNQFLASLAQQLQLGTMSDKTQNRGIDANAALANNDLMLRVIAALGLPTANATATGQAGSSPAPTGNTGTSGPSGSGSTGGSQITSNSLTPSGRSVQDLVRQALANYNPRIRN